MMLLLHAELGNDFSFCHVFAAGLLADPDSELDNSSSHGQAGMDLAGASFDIPPGALWGPKVPVSGVLKVCTMLMAAPTTVTAGSMLDQLCPELDLDLASQAAGAPALPNEHACAI